MSGAGLSGDSSGDGIGLRRRRRFWKYIRLLCLSLNAGLLLFSFLGGYLIGAVDPWFQFRFIETPDDAPDTHWIDPRRVGIPADRLQYDFFHGRRAGAGCTFYRGDVAVAYLGGRHPVYFGFLDVNGDGRRDILCRSDDEGNSTGVWALDTQGPPRDYLHEFPFHPSHGALKRLPKTSRSRMIFAMADYLSGGIIYIPAALFVLSLQSVFWSIASSQRRRRKRWRGRRWRPLGVFPEP
ncbi:MAG: hypothetical protein ABIY70_14130 [Capsulimonas sp.]|uniref:hypothetical protein n=1 Tax=Capsulimonas sp. TaxID=2494211 RepID=UPI003267E4C9